MEFAERFQLKRKCQDGDIHELYLNNSNDSIKRPLYELDNDQSASSKLNPSLLSPGNGYHLSGGTHGINHVSLSTEDVIFMDSGRTAICTDDDKPQPMNSLISTCHIYDYDTIGDPVARDLSSTTESSTVPKSPVKSHGCSECLAGKSGHIHHIGRWKLIDSPNGFCQI